MNAHCWLCDADVEPVEGRCPDCDERIRDPDEGPSERQIEDAMNYCPPRPFTMLDKDDPGRYRP